MAESFSDRMMQLMGSGIFEGHDGSKVLQDSVGNRMVLSTDDLRLIELTGYNLVYLTNESHVDGVAKNVNSEERWKELEKGLEIQEKTVRFVDEESKRKGEEEKIREREGVLKERSVQVENLREGYRYRQENHLPGLGEQVANIRRLITSGRDFSKELDVLSRQKDAVEDIERLKKIMEVCEALDEMGQEKDLDRTREKIEGVSAVFETKPQEEKSSELEAGKEQSIEIFKEFIELQKHIQMVEESGFEGAKMLAEAYKLQVGKDGVPKVLKEKANRVRRFIGEEMVEQLEVRIDGYYANDLAGLKVDFDRREKHLREVQAYIDTNDVGEAIKISMEFVMETVGMNPKEWESGVITIDELDRREVVEKQRESNLVRELEKKDKGGLLDFVSSVKEKREKKVGELQRELSVSRDRIRRLGWQKDVLFELEYGKKFLEVLKEEKTPAQ